MGGTPDEVGAGFGTGFVGFGGFVVCFGSDFEDFGDFVDFVDFADFGGKTPVVPLEVPLVA